MRHQEFNAVERQRGDRMTERMSTELLNQIDHRPKGDTLMYLHDELVRARIREIQEDRGRQRLVRLLERRNFWHRMATIATRQARKADAAI